MTGNSGAGAGAKQKRQLFPEKLWELVNSQQGSGIRWSPDNSQCIEIERAKLERYLQTKFRSQNFDSFIRQLHFYGFKKCGNSYYHDKFQRDQPDRIHSMRRKYSLNMLAAHGPSHHHRPANNSGATRVASGGKPNGGGGNSISNINKRATGQHQPVAAAANPLQPRADSMHKSGPKLKSRPWEEIKLYAVEATGDSDVGSFTSVRETSARAIKDAEGQLKISIPRSLVNIAGASAKQDGPWPRSLVLECYKHGEQSILSAFFLYRLN